MSRVFTRQRLALAAIAFAIFVETIDTSIVSLALPTIAEDFGAEFARVQWVVLISVLTQASLSLVIGWLGDVFGNKRILLAGIGLTALGNVLCAAAPSLAWLIAFRAVQGVGLTMLGALILAIVSTAFHGSQQSQAFGFIGTMVSIGIVVGPLTGGLILRHFPWRAIFLFDLAIIGVTFPLVLKYLDATPGAGKRAFDVWGACAFFVSLLAFLFASTYEGGGALPGAPPLWYALSALMAGAFVWHELRTRQPMLNLGLFRTRAFTVYLGARYIVFLVFGGVWLILPFYLETMIGLEPDVIGLLLTVQPLFFGAGSWTAGHLMDRSGRRPLILMALLALGAGYAWMSFLTADWRLWAFVAQMTLVGLGFGFLHPPANSIVFGSVQRRNLGMVSSLTTLVRIHSRTLGIAVLGNVWLALTRWRTAGADSLLPGEYDAQIASFGTVCLIGAVIIGLTWVVCLGETVGYRRRRAGHL